MKKLILFDIDSTLLRDGGAAEKAFGRAFFEQYAQLPGKVDKFGKTDFAIAHEVAAVTLNRPFEGDELDRLHRRYCELYPALLDESQSFMLYPGVADLCASLAKNKTFFLGLQTGNLEPCARLKLKKAGLDSFFRFGGFGSDSMDRPTLVAAAIRRGKKLAGEEIKNSDVVCIGDSVHDIHAGKENGTFTIGVATGKNSIEELCAAGADAAVNDLTADSGIENIIKTIN